MHLLLAAALLPDVQGDAVSLLLGADQVHVVGNEELPGPGYRGAPRRDEERRAEVGGPFITFQLG